MTETVKKKPPKRRLKTLNDIRRYLAATINETRRGECDPALAGKLGFLLNILKSTITDSDLEARVKKIEEALERSRKRRF